VSSNQSSNEQKKEEKNKIKKISRAMSAKIIKEKEAEEKTAKQRLSRAANNSDILQNVITGLANGGRAEAALRVATRCIRRGFQLPQKHLWLSILKGALSRPKLGRKIWQIMKKSSVVLDNATWTAFIRTKGSNSEEALSVLRQMRSQHIVATSENCSAVLESCVAGSNPEGTSMMLKLMLSRSMIIESEVFCRMIQAAVRPMTKEALIQGVEILQFMRSSGGRPDLRTCKAIFDSTAKLGDATTATLLMLQIQNTNEANRKKTGNGKGKGKGKGKELVKNNIVMIDHDLCLSYVQSLCRGHQLATAVQFVRQNMCAVDSGVVPGTLIWSTLLEGCARSQDIGRADDIYREMQHRGVLSNRNGRRALASLYARFDKIENAISVLFSNDSGTEIAWPGLSAAKQLLYAICRHLDNIKSKATTTRIAVGQLCLIFRSGNLQQRSDLVAIGKMTPMCIDSRLRVLKTTFNFPSILELDSFFQ
jgi:pentatricopeptide repeat protein